MGAEERRLACILFCCFIFGGYVYWEIPEFGKPCKPVLPVVYRIAELVQNWDYASGQDIAYTAISLIALGIGYFLAYGSIGWLLCHAFPVGSTLEMLQVWDVLPLLLPLLELSENTFKILATRFGGHSILSWGFIAGWMNGVHFFTYWMTLFLLLCCFMYTAMIQLSDSQNSIISPAFPLQSRKTDSSYNKQIFSIMRMYAASKVKLSPEDQEQISKFLHDLQDPKVKKS